LSLGWARAGAEKTAGAETRAKARPSARIAALLSAHATSGGRRLAGAGGFVTVTLGVGGREIARAEIRDDRWRLIEAPLPPAFCDAIGGGEVLEIRADPVYVPDRLLHNGDRRALGVRVAAVRMLDGDPSNS